MAGNEGLRPWPRIRDTWWVFGLGVTALGLFLLGFLVDLRCGFHGCRGSVPFRLLDVDAVGSLPRLFTTALFAGVAVMAWRARRSIDGAARWWAAVAAVASALALAKLVGLHATLKNASPWSAHLGGLVLAAGTIGVLWVWAHRSDVAAGPPVVLALGLYLGMALGLDLMTGVAAAVQDRVGWLTVAGTTFVEELGEALAALTLLVTVRWQAAVRPEPVGAAG